MTQDMSPAEFFEQSIRTDPEGIEPFLEVSVRCSDCVGCGVDPVKAPGFIPGGSNFLPADPRPINHIRCESCGGSGSVRRWISVSDLEEFVSRSVVARADEIVAAMKEAALRAVMDS